MIDDPALLDFPAPDAKSAAASLPVAGQLMLPAATREDLPFLCDVYCAFRAPAFAQAGLAEAQIVPLLQSQFRMQHTHLLQHHPRADYWVVRHHDSRIGRLYLDRTTPQWHLLDLILSPVERGRGLGGTLLGWLQARAIAEQANGIRLHVAFENPRAKALYQRHGFADDGPPQFPQQPMRWDAPV